MSDSETSVSDSELDENEVNTNLEIPADENLGQILSLVRDTSEQPNLTRLREGREILNTSSKEFCKNALLTPAQISKESLLKFHQETGGLFHLFKSNDGTPSVLVLGYPNKFGLQTRIRTLNTNAIELAKELFGKNIAVVPLHASHANDHWFVHQTADNLERNSNRSGQTVTASAAVNQLQSNTNRLYAVNISDLNSIPQVFLARLFEKYNDKVIEKLERDYKLHPQLIYNMAERDSEVVLHEAADIQKDLYRSLENEQKGKVFLTEQAFNKIMDVAGEGVRHAVELGQRQNQETEMHENESSDLTKSIKRFHAKKENNFSQGFEDVDEMITLTIQDTILQRAIKNTSKDGSFDGTATLEAPIEKLCNEIGMFVDSEKDRISEVFQTHARTYSEPTACYEFKSGVNLLDANINTEEKFSASTRLDMYNILKDSMLTRSDATQLRTKAKNYELSLNGKSKADLELAQSEHSERFLDFINNKPLFSRKFRK